MVPGNAPWDSKLVSAGIDRSLYMFIRLGRKPRNPPQLRAEGGRDRGRHAQENQQWENFNKFLLDRVMSMRTLKVLSWLLVVGVVVSLCPEMPWQEERKVGLASECRRVR